MKIKYHPVSGFSLVEVTLALGVAAFCLVAVFGLLPVGVSSNQASIEQTAAAGMATRISADLRASKTTTPSTPQNSPLYQIPTPVSGAANTSTYTLFLAEDGTPANITQGGNANPSLNPRYRATLSFTAPAAGQRTATTARILLTWPALADPVASSPPSKFSGSFETVIALDRN